MLAVAAKFLGVKWIAWVMCTAWLSGGCKVCVNACKKDQGRAITAIVPNADGTLKITTCTLTTEGAGGTVDACRDHLIPSGTPPK